MSGIPGFTVGTGNEVDPDKVKAIKSSILQELKGL